MKSLIYIEVDVPEFAAIEGGEKDVIAGLEFDFETNSVLDWTAGEATLTATTSGMTVVPTGDDPMIRCAAGQTIDGSVDRYIQIDVERTAVRTVGVWQGSIFYVTDGHPESSSFSKTFPELENVVGARRTYQLDMHDLNVGGTDWADNIITRIRIDFEDGQSGAVTPDGEFKIHSIVIGPRQQTLRFAKPTDYLPRDIDAIPSIVDVNYTPSVISLGQNLGERATLTITFQDHRHIFNGESFNSGTFWGKWRARYGQKLRGRSVRWIQGLLGQTLAEMETRHFVIESTDGPTPDGKYTIIAKDILKLADNDRAQAPRPSNGFIVANIDADDTAVTLSPSGIGNAEYPAGGHVAIGGKEICAFTRSGDDLTLTRGQLSTEAISHEAGDRAQLVLRYVGEDPANIISDLFQTYAGVPSTYIPIAAWLAETEGFLQRLYTATIAEPTGVNKLVSELIEQAALAVWDDNLNQSIRLQVLRAISTTAAIYDEGNTIEGSLSSKEQPDSRISEVWTYFGQRNACEPVDRPDNYRSLAITADLESEGEYGGAAIKKIFSRWIPFGGRQVAERLNNIQLGRFKDPPRRFTLSTWRYDEMSPILGGGYRLKSWTIQDTTGAASDAPIQVTRLNPTPDHFELEGEEMLFSGTDQVDLTDRVIIIDSAINNVNLRDLHDGIYPDPAVGDSPEVTLTVYIEENVIVGSSSTATPALDVGSWPSGFPITVILRGRIQGHGGNGGHPEGNGLPGGPALYARFPIDLILDEGDGEIWGGGGGGGGHNDPDRGGGGGAGQLPGSGGPGSNGVGANGTTESGGEGASGGGFSGGGDAGGPGQSGEASSQRLGGAAGLAIDGLSFVTKTGTGDIRGSQTN